MTSAGDYLSVPDPPYKRVYPHFRAFHMHLISRETVFAPSVLLLDERNSFTNQLIKADMNPSYLWGFLLFLEKLWEMDRKDFCIEWGPINGAGVNQWLESDQRWKHSRQSFLSSRLKTVDTPNFQKNDFDRPFYKNLIEKLILGLSLDKGYTQPTDIAKLREFINNQWEKKPNAKHADILCALKKKIAEDPKWLKRTFQDSTLRTRIRECDQRPEKPRGPGKKSF